MKILVALSGGIDSSVAAHLLAEQGHELVGVRFTLWSDPLAPTLAKILPSKCCNTQTAARARSVAERLGIPYHIVDLEEEFKREVVDPFLEGYRNGLTPNPCIRCNRTIKFGKLLELAEEFHCEMLATGHYARTAIEKLQIANCKWEMESNNLPFAICHLPFSSERYLLLEAADKSKDQSYYLYGLSQEQLRRTIFPLGTMHKREVFALAQHFGIPYEEETYRESQDLCFFPEKTPEAFLRRHLEKDLRPGPIIRRNGDVVGTHDGLPLYTPGQRRGLKIGGQKIPLEVVEKDTERNALVVASKDEERTPEVHLTELRWVSWSPPEGESVPFECRTRSLSERKRGTLRFRASSGTFAFEDPQGPQAAGQSLVLYRGEEVVGGGVMA